MASILSEQYLVYGKSSEKSDKACSGFSGKQLQRRLQILGLTTSEKRRETGDLIETYNILTGKERVSRKQFFQLALAGTGTCRT